MGGDIAFIVVGGLAALAAGFLGDARLRGRFSKLNLSTGTTAFDIVLSTGIMFSTFGALWLSDGETGWIQLIWIVTAFLGAIVLYGVPFKLRTMRAKRREIDEPAP